MNGSNDRLRYVIITPSRNEAKNIERLIASVASQTVLPMKWIIINDNSTDNTGCLVSNYLSTYPWMVLINSKRSQERNFGSKVECFNAGLQVIKDLNFDIIGNIDADVSFKNNYFEFLLAKFSEDPNLGVAGTPFVEDSGYSSDSDSYEGELHVAGGCQLFRRRCFEDIGGYVANRKGGIDWIAVTTARMKGWKTHSFSGQSFHHHRALGTGESNGLAALFSYGRKDYYLGNHPIWEILRVAFQMTKKPFVVFGLVLFSGYLWEALRREMRPVSQELMEFHRKEEMQKMKTIILTLFQKRSN